MKELQECLQHESWFKRVNQDSMVPPLQIDSFHEKPSYYGWLVGLLVTLLLVILIGCTVEVYQYWSNKKRDSKFSRVELLDNSTRKEDIL